MLSPFSWILCFAAIAFGGYVAIVSLAMAAVVELLLAAGELSRRVP